MLQESKSLVFVLHIVLLFDNLNLLWIHRVREVKNLLIWLSRIKVKMGPILEFEHWDPVLISGLGYRWRKWCKPLVWGRLPLPFTDLHFTFIALAVPHFTIALSLANEDWVGLRAPTVVDPVLSVSCSGVLPLCQQNSRSPWLNN